VAKREIIKDFNQTLVPKEEHLRPLLGKFWHKIPDSKSPGTRSQDGNGRRKRTFVALYGRISYQMHRARVVHRKTKEVCPSAALSRDSLMQRFALMRSLEIISDLEQRSKLISTNLISLMLTGKKKKYIYTYILYAFFI